MNACFTGNMGETSKESGNTGKTSKERALILCFPSMEAKKDFLKNRSTLKKTDRIFLGYDLTLSQICSYARGNARD